MSKRFIDADALKSRMFNYYECVNENTGKSNYNGETLMNYEVADMIEDCIENAPTADVVEVVRCRVCKHRNTHDCYLWVGTISDVDYLIATSDDFYCSYGERRAEE